MTALELLRKADTALASAKRELDAGDLDGAANRLYYAMFHAARAALLDGPLPMELGRAMNEAQELRVEGDYGAGTPVASEVAAYVLKAEQFGSQRSGVLCQVWYRVPLAEASQPVVGPCPAAPAASGGSGIYPSSPRL